MSEGLRITFDPGLDHGAWPGPLATRDAVMGELWIGPLGLVARLETELGLGARRTSPTERAAALAGLLSTRTGWWRASYEADALATARRLLRDRDLLCMWGWRGEPAGDRLQQLWTATQGARPGLPDRLRAVSEQLDVLRPEIEVIETYTPPSALEPLWRDVFAKLATAGVRIVGIEPPAASAKGDLAASRDKGFVPKGDGTLALLRTHGPLAAADEVAASLAALPSRESVVIVGGDDVLDEALARHGLPRIGAVGRPTGSSSLLRLVIEAAFEPMEPADLHALLAMPVGPIPRRVGAPLVQALSKFPGRRNQLWKDKLKEGLEECDEEFRAEAAARVDTLVMPAVHREAKIQVAELDRRLECLYDWAASRKHKNPSLLALEALVDEMRDLLTHYGTPELSLVELRKLCDDLGTERGFGVPAQAGLAAVSDPAAMLAPARIVIWWNFTRGSAPRATRMRLSEAERAQLTALSISPPDPGHLMEGEATRWRRPLALASDVLVLVCPNTTEEGDENTPHPLWDELCASMPDPRHAASLITQRLALPAPAARRKPALRALPVFKPTVQVGAAINLRERESPSGLEKLLGCPLSWALNYQGKLFGGMASGVDEPSPLLYGNLAHVLLAKVFGGGVIDADVAYQRAKDLVEVELPELAENLCLPRYQAELTEIREAIINSAKELSRLLVKSGASIRGVELAHETTVDGHALKGTADMVLDGPDTIIDLKWGRSSHQEKLETGSALQLAAYAQMFGGAKPMQVAYFSLNRQKMLAIKGSTLPEVYGTGTATARDTWTGALVSLNKRKTELAKGELHAPHAEIFEKKHEVKPNLDAAGLTMSPTCQYCGYGALCGRERGA
jgi:hypothetical protein